MVREAALVVFSMYLKHFPLNNLPQQTHISRQVKKKILLEEGGNLSFALYVYCVQYDAH